MANKRGFTLVEILVVVVIALSVMAFAVPAFKKTQERSRYLAAKGILLDLGSAVVSMQSAMSMEGGGSFPSSKTQITDAISGETSYLGQLKDYSSDGDLAKAMFSRKYLNPIPFDIGKNTYKGYSFYACSSSVFKCPDSGLVCCTSKSVACMCNQSVSAQYKNLYVLADGRTGSN